MSYVEINLPAIIASVTCNARQNAYRAPQCLQLKLSLPAISYVDIKVTRYVLH